MPEWTIVFLSGLGMMLFFSAVGVPIAFSLAMAAFLGLSIFRSPTVAFAGIRTVVFGGPSEIALLPIPLFVLMASMLIAFGLSTRAYDAFTRLFAGFKAGLPVATNYMLAFFGALMGSSAAAIGMVTQMGAPELKARGYSNSIIGGVIAGGSGLAVIIPPSILAILYAFVMNMGVITIFAAGVVPGILIAIGYSIWVMLYIRWKPPAAVRQPVAAASPSEPVAAAAPSSSGGHQAMVVPDYIRKPRFSEKTLAALEGRITLRGRLEATLEIVPMVIVMVVTLGSMFLGYASITEGAAVGVTGVLVVSLLYGLLARFSPGARQVVRALFITLAVGVVVAVGVRLVGLADDASQAVVSGVMAVLLAWLAFGFLSRAMSARAFWWGLWNTIMVSGFIMLLIVGGRYFGMLYNLTGVTREFRGWITGLPLTGIPLLLAIMGIFLFFGCIMETISMMLVLVPIAAGALVALGWDPILLGILFVVNLEMALTTPPIGVNLFVLAGMARPYGITFEDIMRGAIPFLVVDAIVLLGVIYYPPLAMTLANAVK